jgi:Cu(I)/Ag(I) efflux system membrane protein CusA/SilA
MAGLLPIMWSTGTGSEIMQRIAVPMIGGMISSTLLTLIVIPAIYALVKGAALARIFHPAINPEGKPSEAGIS